LQTSWESAWRTIPARPPRSCLPPVRLLRLSSPCGFRLGRSRWPAVCAPRHDAREHLSVTHQDTRQGIDVFPCHQIGISAATTCRRWGQLPDTSRRHQIISWLSWQVWRYESRCPLMALGATPFSVNIVAPNVAPSCPQMSMDGINLCRTIKTKKAAIEVAFSLVIVLYWTS